MKEKKSAASLPAAGPQGVSTEINGGNTAAPDLNGQFLITISWSGGFVDLFVLAEENKLFFLKIK